RICAVEIRDANPETLQGGETISPIKHGIPRSRTRRIKWPQHDRLAQTIPCDVGGEFLELLLAHHREDGGAGMDGVECEAHAGVTHDGPLAVERRETRSRRAASSVRIVARPGCVLKAPASAVRAADRAVPEKISARTV